MVVNLVLIIVCIFSYAGTIYSLVYWTYLIWPSGEKGGVLDFRLFGINVVYHVVQESLVTVFSFPDTTPYLITVFIIFNLSALFLNLGLHMDFDQRRIRNYAFLSVIIAALCMWAYVSEMGFIENRLKTTPHIGGVVIYSPLFDIHITHVYQGEIESSLNWPSPDFPLLLLILLLILTSIVISYKIKRNKMF